VEKFHVDQLSADGLKELEDEFLRGLPFGVSKGNGALMQELYWAEDKYWEIKNRLLDQGKVRVGRGRGGATIRLFQFEEEKPKAPESPVEAVKASFPDYSDEKQLYVPVEKVLVDGWLRERGFDRHLVERTSSQGSRATGGAWSRPDLTIVGYKTFAYLPTKYLDVVTFEIKPAHEISVKAVYEALSHRRGATRCYVVLHTPNQVELDDVISEAKKFGVGVITISDFETKDGWLEEVEADRIEPDPERLNNFISVQIAEANKQEILKWLR
jgi:hypothetical protein